MHEQKPSKRLFLSQAASCTHRSYLRLSPPLLTVQNCQFLLRNCFSPPRGFVQTSQKNCGILRFNYKLSYFLKKCQEKNHFFLLFLLKSVKKRYFLLFQLLFYTYIQFRKICKTSLGLAEK